MLAVSGRKHARQRARQGPPLAHQSGTGTEHNKSFSIRGHSKYKYMRVVQRLIDKKCGGNGMIHFTETGTGSGCGWYGYGQQAITAGGRMSGPLTWGREENDDEGSLEASSQSERHHEPVQHRCNRYGVHERGMHLSGVHDQEPIYRLASHARRSGGKRMGKGKGLDVPRHLPRRCGQNVAPRGPHRCCIAGDGWGGRTRSLRHYGPEAEQMIDQPRVLYEYHRSCPPHLAGGACGVCPRAPSKKYPLTT